MKVYFATGNEHKIREAKAILGKENIDVEPFFIKRVEIQANNLE